jgi:hypothetical protein
MNAFYQLPNNSIDVLFLGASSYRQGIQPLVLWEDHGFTSYVRANGSQGPMVSYYYLVESWQYQKPSVVVIDGIGLWNSYDVDEKEPRIRRAVDPMRFSITKLQLISEIVNHSQSQKVIDYLFSFFRYHNRWSNLTAVDFHPAEEHRLRGVIYFTQVTPQKFPQHFMEPTSKIAKIDDQAFYYYEKMIRLCEENDITVIFATLPRTFSTYARYNATSQLAEQYEFEYLDYNLPKNLTAIQLDANTDFVNPGHLNVFGALKVTHDLGNYLQERFHFTDKRDNPQFEQWNADLQYFKTMVPELENNNE